MNACTVHKYRTVFSPCMEYSNSDNVTVCPLCFIMLIQYKQLLSYIIKYAYMYVFILASFLNGLHTASFLKGLHTAALSHV